MSYLEILKKLDFAATKPAVSALTAVPHRSATIKAKYSTVCRTENPDAVREHAKLEARKEFPGPHYTRTIACDFEAAEIVAFEIFSELLQANIWLAFDEGFDPVDGQAVFYPHELQFLKNKTPDQIRTIHAVKLGGGPGLRVRQ